MTVRSVGVEEELLLVEPGTGQPRAVAETALRDIKHPEDTDDESPGSTEGGDAGGGDGRDAQSLDFELQRQQLETNTRPCRDLDALRDELHRCRSLAAAVAGRAGVRIAALATSPVPVVPQLVRSGRHLEMARAFGLTAYEQLTCGCHVHVEIASPDEGIAVLDRIGPWLPVLLALSANSPFWQGQDSAYASFRYQAWGRWPNSGPTEAFGTAEAYERTVRQMVATGTLIDTGMVYFDARLSQHYPTVEVRIADVCLYADDAVLIAALTRALVDTEARRWRAGARAPRQPAESQPAESQPAESQPAESQRTESQRTESQRTEILRLASWRASRSGLDQDLLSPRTGRPEPAAAVARMLLEHVRDSLDEAGDTATVTGLLTAVLNRGNGSAFQRAAYRDDGDLAAVVDRAAAATTPVRS